MLELKKSVPIGMCDILGSDKFTLSSDFRLNIWRELTISLDYFTSVMYPNLQAEGTRWIFLIIPVPKMQTGKGGKRWKHCADRGHDPHRIYFKDICFTCSFVVTLRYLKILFKIFKNKYLWKKYFKIFFITLYVQNCIFFTKKIKIKNE